MKGSGSCHCFHFIKQSCHYVEILIIHVCVRVCVCLLGPFYSLIECEGARSLS